MTGRSRPTPRPVFAAPSDLGAASASAVGATTRPGIVFSGVTKRFVSPTGAVMTAARDINMEIAPGEFCAIVGPTGCGKSTTLTMVSGLSEPSEGTVSVFGRPVNGVTPDAGFVFQADALMPWKSVLDNVALGPKFRGEPKAQSVDKARGWLKTVGLEGFENHYPHQLSGGMRKRAALAAALINEPKMLLMDEPFSALDVQTRAIMSDELLNVWERTKPSVLFVTHDLEESIFLADKVVVITAGPGTVKAIFKIDLPRPRGSLHEVRFTARFLELYRQIWEALREEVARAYARTTSATGAAA